MLIPDFEVDFTPEITGDFALMATNPSLEIIHWNKGAERLLGFTREEALGRLPFEVFMTPQDFTRAAEYCSQLISGRVQDVELWAQYSARDSRGHRVACHWYHQMVYGSDDGKLLVVLCLVVPAASTGKQLAYQAVVDQYAIRLQRWVDEREQRWGSWNRMFDEHCTAAQFDQGRYAALTPRERELVQELSHSLRLKVVARKLDISLNTARNHLKSIFAKLQVHSQEQLIREVRALSSSQRVSS